MTDYSIKKKLLQLLEVPIAVLKRFRSDRLSRHAAALAFSSLLALAPMLAIVFAMLSLFASFEELGSSLQDFIYQFLVPAASDDLRQYLEQFAGQAGKLTLVSLAMFLLTALVLLNNIEESFNDIWRVKTSRSLSAKVTIYWALLSLGPLLMGASLAISTYLLSLTVINSVGFTQQIHSVGVTLLPFLFEVLAFLLLYSVMPNVRVNFLHALTGALVASLLFQAGKRLFSAYIVNFDSYQIVYGALSTLPIFLILIFVSWIIALIGAQVVAVLQEKKMLLMKGEVD